MNEKTNTSGLMTEIVKKKASNIAIPDHGELQRVRRKEQQEKLRAGPPVMGIVLTGMLVIAIFFGGFGAWATLAPLASAAIAQGKIIVESNRKTIQHLEGGIIEEILVKEGSRVNAGDLLISLAPLQAETRVESLRFEYDNALAAQARLNALINHQDRIEFPAEITDRLSNAEVASIAGQQTDLFTAARQNLDGQYAILNQRIEQQRNQITGYQEQVNSADEQLRLIGEELDAVLQLYEKELAPKTRVLELQRAMARIRGTRGDMLARVAQAREGIGENEMRIISLEKESIESSAKELEAVVSHISELRESLRAAEDVLQRHEVYSPIDGTIVDMQYFTLGGVIAAGQPIMDIVPDEDKLIIEAWIDPIDIDVVHEGLLAEVRLTAFNQRSTPTFMAELLQVSADSIEDERRQLSYYKGLVEIGPEALAEQPNIDLYPGMPVEVMIKLNDRTFVDYLMAPLTQSFARAFRED